MFNLIQYFILLFFFLIVVVWLGTLIFRQITGKKVKESVLRVLFVFTVLLIVTFVFFFIPSSVKPLRIGGQSWAFHLGIEGTALFYTLLGFLFLLLYKTGNIKNIALLSLICFSYIFIYSLYWFFVMPPYLETIVFRRTPYSDYLPADTSVFILNFVVSAGVIACIIAKWLKRRIL